MGALVMAHSDDDGLVIPPKLAPIQAVIVPIYKGEESVAQLNAAGEKLKKELEAKGIRVKFDHDEKARPGWKFAEYELKGVPVRIAMGMRDLENGTVEVVRRDTREKESLQTTDIGDKVLHLLEKIQLNIFQKAVDYRREMTHKADNWEEFVDLLDNKGGFIAAHWDGTPETETKIKEMTKATIRCIPLNNTIEAGKCILSGQPSTQRVLFAKAY